MKKGKNELKQENGRVQQAQKKSYSTPTLIVHGSVENITQDKGLLLSDGIVSGSVLG